jgi:hypothetical protein
MLTTAGSPIRHARDILSLLDAVLLPKVVLVIHCKGHQKGEDKTAKGNKVANEATKPEAMQEYIYSWPPSLGEDAPSPRETTLSVRGKQTSLRPRVPVRSPRLVGVPWRKAMAPRGTPIENS